MNFKLKGTGHSITPSHEKPTCGEFGIPIGTMIVGADIGHPGKVKNGCPSMAAVVATNKDDTIHFLGSARLQTSKQEVRILDLYV